MDSTAPQYDGADQITIQDCMDCHEVVQFAALLDLADDPSNKPQVCADVCALSLYIGKQDPLSDAAESSIPKRNPALVASAFIKHSRSSMRLANLFALSHGQIVIALSRLSFSVHVIRLQSVCTIPSAIIGLVQANCFDLPIGSTSAPNVIQMQTDSHLSWIFLP